MVNRISNTNHEDENNNNQEEPSRSTDISPRTLKQLIRDVFADSSDKEEDPVTSTAPTSPIPYEGPGRPSTSAPDHAYDRPSTPAPYEEAEWASMETIQPRNNPGPYLDDTHPVYLAP